MAPKLLEGPQRSRRRVAIYGDPKTRKTNLATAFSSRKSLYIPSDPGADGLESVTVPERLSQVSIGPDVYKSLSEIASYNWSADGFDTIIWDTVTASARDMLYSFTDAGVFSDKNIAVGKKGDAHYTAQPQMGDYGITQRAINQLLGKLFLQPLNVVCVFHAELSDREGTPVYGPKTVGQATIRDIAGLFDNLLHTESIQLPVAGKPGTTETQFKVHMQTHGRWLAGVRATKAIPPYTLGNDPREFWTWFEGQTSNDLRRKGELVERTT